MPGATTKHAIPYPTPTDPVRDGDDRIKALAERVDLLLGETGLVSITPSAADVATSLRVDYGRSYAPGIPRVMVMVNENVGATLNVNVWPAAADATGFTLWIRSSNTTTRQIRWDARL